MKIVLCVNLEVNNGLLLLFAFFLRVFIQNLIAMNIHPLLTEINSKLDVLFSKIETIMVAKSEMFNSKEAANYLIISLSTLNKLASDGEIPYYKPHGKLRYFKRRDLDEYKNRGRNPSRYEL